MSKKIDLAGQKFVRLTVVREATNVQYANGEILWECICSCGNNTPIYCSGSLLRQGKKKSCGCIWKPTQEDYIINLKLRLEKNSKWNGECQEWKGLIDSNGYGRISLNTREKNMTVHRLSWLIHIGNIPEGMAIYHLCGNPSCFRPEHLHLGSEKNAPKKDNNLPQGEKKSNSKITEEQAKDIYKFRNSGINSHDIACRYNISASNVRSIWQKRNWKFIHDKELIEH